MQLKSSLISFNHHFDSPVIPTKNENPNHENVVWIFCFQQNTFLSLVKKPFFPLFLWRREKRQKRHPPPPSRPLYGADVIDSGQKPPSIKVLVWLPSLCPFGVSHAFSSAYAKAFAHEKTSNTSQSSITSFCHSCTLCALLFFIIFYSLLFSFILLRLYR